MKIVESILTKNNCYIANRQITVKGLMLHSVGCSQPSAEVFIKNWNTATPNGSQVCVHGFIDAAGNVYQTLPWNWRGWHCGSGANGSGNNTHIGVEMTEPASIKYTGGASFTDNNPENTKAHVMGTYKTAVELFAKLCVDFKLNPLGDGVIISHKEGCSRGIASNHGDPEHLWGKFGLTMNQFRADVKAAMTITPPIITGANDEIIWNFLKGKGLNDFAIAGIMGNLYAESALKSTNLQNSFETKLGLNDDAYTKAVDNGTYTNFVKDGAGYGLAQWTFYTRKQALLDFAKAAGASVGDLITQLNFLWRELQGYTAVVAALKSACSVLDASNAVLLDYERPADQSEAVKAKRAGYGQTYYDKFAGKTTTPSTPELPPVIKFEPYTVKVTASELNIRKGAGTNYAVVGSIKDKGVYTIVEEADGAGAKKWGKLKSGAGWISLDYTQRR